MVDILGKTAAWLSLAYHDHIFHWSKTLELIEPACVDHQISLSHPRMLLLFHRPFKLSATRSIILRLPPAHQVELQGLLALIPPFLCAEPSGGASLPRFWGSKSGLSSLLLEYIYFIRDSFLLPSYFSTTKKSTPLSLLFG